jgi:hypothetical protein
MSHLRESEVVDLLDNVLPAARARHVDECSTCMEKIDTLRSTLQRVTDVEVPEPSPLFWDHFSARVRENVKEATPGSASPWATWIHHAGVRWALAGALVGVIVVAGLWRVGPMGTNRPGVVRSTEAVETTLDASAADDDVAWSLVREVADEVHWDDQVAATLDPHPGTVERAVLALKGEERAELVRLLEAATKRPGA